MTELIALIDRNSKDWIEVESLLMTLNFRIHLAKTLEEVQRLTEMTDCRVVILDLDMIEIANRFFKSLKKGDPELTILAVSARPFHPELKEAMSHYICACFRKPLDTEEIEFWLRAVMNSAPSRDPTVWPQQ